MDLELDDQQVVITGAAGRIGSVLSREFARVGADVIMLDIDGRVHAEKREICDAIDAAVSGEDILELDDEGIFDAGDGPAGGRDDSNEGGAAGAGGGGGAVADADADETDTTLDDDEVAVVVSSECDITDYEEVIETLEELRTELGIPDILVNNAAITDSLGPLAEYDNDDWYADVEANLTGAYHMTRALFPAMIEQGWGRIVTISSMAAQQGASNRVSYAASKAGLTGLAKTAAIEGGRHGVTSNVVATGVVAEELSDMTPDELTAVGGNFDTIAKNTAVGRIGREMDVAPLVLFLASPYAAYITGQVYAVNGGVDLA